MGGTDTCIERRQNLPLSRMKLFCLSGLGVDERAFVHFQPDGIELVHIPWIEPEKNESLKNYAHRLFESTELPADYAVLGVSFGGMIATEFAQIRQPSHLFLVSSAEGQHDLPWKFLAGRFLPLHRLLPKKMLISSSWVIRYLFSVKQPEERQMLQGILSTTNPEFLRWAMHAIVHWKGYHHTNSIRIHGAHDRMLPSPKNIQHRIQGAGHFMIVNRAVEIEEIVRLHLKC